VIRFTNTLGGDKEDFDPLGPPRVNVYVCGPTVYDVAHVGHARAAVAFDVLRRHLTWRGYDVFFVRNITDVDDRIIARAKELGVDPAVVAERYTRSYEGDLKALNVLPPDVAPRATGHLLEMQDMIATLIERGYAYPGEGSVYFSVEKFEAYGKLSGRGLDVLATRERVEPAPGKHHPLDFALWKAAKPGEVSWRSPWGPGRPGWHIECSAMAARYLGQPFDIHGGGADLIFPHHENEIAQAEAAAGKPFARYWLHNGHLMIRGEEMHKSLKNFIEIGEVLRTYTANVVRLFFCSAHYRSQIDYSPDSLDEARSVLERFRSFLRAAPGNDVGDDEIATRLEGFGAAMDDDLNTPGALAALHELTSQGNRAVEAGDEAGAAAARAAVEAGLGVLGFDVASMESRTDVVGPLVELLLEQREAARLTKDFAGADEIRARLQEIGIHVEDSPDGPRWFVD
jgi:cysteinyl-tRNA synthetase